ncbi:phage portal protein [Mycobacterium hodleri]|uniref:phage portal protein n=1 Tax=Mycolicibacterium hodleri TaxID=49897 RepID=UPI0021F2ECE4|nr:phage portal protein [Mycolicibacterium hodleri]MCV7132518.1 phage portal protein [Mycolicibacterium hodleri]
MNSPLLNDLLDALNAPQARLAELHRYATGTQRQAFLSEESRKALDSQLYRLAVNIPALSVSSLCERLRIHGYSDPRATELFTRTDLDQLATQAMSDALTYGTGYVLVWAKNGKLVASVEDPSQCAVLKDPADRSVLAGIKRYQTASTTEVYIYLADEVQHWSAPTKGGVTYALVETIPNPTGMVPLIPIDNGRSELDDLRGPVDALNKVILCMLVGVHRAGFGRSWVTGLELTERPILDGAGNPLYDDEGNPLVEVVSPIDDLSTLPMAIAEAPDTKFGNFNEPTLGGFETAVRVLVSQIMAVSALPSHYLGILTSQPTSADAVRASEASLVARVEQRQLTFGRAWEQVGRLLLAIDTNTDTADMPLRVTWAPADTRSEAQVSDSVTKLVQSGILPVSYALRRLGYSEREITDILAARESEIASGMRADIQRYTNATIQNG